MSLRYLFVVSLAECKLLYHKVFPTVEKRWAREHEQFYQPIPNDGQLLELLLTELGLMDKSTYIDTRDSCTKKLQAPLFWVPHKKSEKSLWPVLVFECQNKLFCAVPYLKQSHCSEQIQANKEPDIAIAFEVISKLITIVSLFPPAQLNKQMCTVVQQWLPFGRPNGPQGLELLVKPATNPKGLWMRSKSEVETKINEEIRAVLSSNAATVELYGTITLCIERETDFSNLKIHLTFPKLATQPALLVHPCTQLEVDGSTVNLKIGQIHERMFHLCHYSLALADPPIQAMFKTRQSDLKTSLFIQLYIGLSIRSSLTRLEVHVPIPAGNHITHTSPAASSQQGVVSLSKNATQLTWNLSQLAGGGKLKDDVDLNIDLETAFAVSLSNSHASVVFCCNNSTLSGAQISFPQQIKFKPVIVQELKSSTYRICNYESDQVV